MKMILCIYEWPKVLTQMGKGILSSLLWFIPNNVSAVKLDGFWIVDTVAKVNQIWYLPIMDKEFLCTLTFWFLNLYKPGKSSK